MINSENLRLRLSPISSVGGTEPQADPEALPTRAPYEELFATVMHFGEEWAQAHFADWRMAAQVCLNALEKGDIESKRVLVAARLLNISNGIYVVECVWAWRGLGLFP